MNKTKQIKIYCNFLLLILNVFISLAIHINSEEKFITIYSINFGNYELPIFIAYFVFIGMILIFFQEIINYGIILLSNKKLGDVYEKNKKYEID